MAWLWISGCAGDDKTAQDMQSDSDETDSMVEDSLSPEIEPAINPDDDPEDAYAIVGNKARVTAWGGIYMRTGPGKNYDRKLEMPHGAIVNVLTRENGWYKVTYSGHTGWAYGAHLSPVTDTNTATQRERAIQRAKSGLGFSYHWGSACWNPGSNRDGACYGNCPNCTHSGSWGADCSGYVSKVWQVPGATALTTCTHPYSTFNFRYQTPQWHQIPRSQAKQGDAFVYNSGGAGHMFVVDSGDPWGWTKVYEAKGCSYGIVHDSRTATSPYIAIRRSGYN